MAFPSFSIVHIWLILHSPGCTMLGSELPLSNLTRFCTFRLMLGHDANLNICISHQPWRKRLTLLLFSLRYSCTLPLANTGPTTQVPGKQLAASLASPQAFQLGWATRHTLGFAQSCQRELVQMTAGTDWTSETRCSSATPAEEVMLTGLNAPLPLEYWGISIPYLC